MADVSKINGYYVKDITARTGLTSKADTPTAVSGSGAITVTITDNSEYSYSAVTSLAMTSASVTCHGWITFSSSAPTVTLTGFSAVEGDDITSASASTVWEFSCVNGYAIFKNWSDV